MSDAENPWVVQPKASAAPVPPGAYLATFKGVEDYALPQTGEKRWRWAWLVTGEKERGKMATALTNIGITQGTQGGNLIAGLLNRALVDGEDVKAAIDACVGKTYTVTVQGGPKGGKPQVRSAFVPPT